MVKIKSALQISNYLSRCRDHGKKLVIRLIQRFQEVYFCFSVQFVQSFSSFGLKNETYEQIYSDIQSWTLNNEFLLSINFRYWSYISTIILWMSVKYNLRFETYNLISSHATSSNRKNNNRMQLYTFFLLNFHPFYPANNRSTCQENN